MPVTSSAPARRTAAPSTFSICVLSQKIEPRLHHVARGAGELLVGEDAQARAAALPRPRRACRPHRPASGWRRRRRARIARRAPATAARRGHRSRRRAPSARRRCSALASEPPAEDRGGETKTVKPADDVAFDHDLACLADFGLQHRVFLQPPHQHTGAAVDKAFRQTFVQRVGKLILYARARHPANAPDRRASRDGWRQKSRSGHARSGWRAIDVAVGVVGLRDLAGEPVVGDAALSHQKAVERDGKFRMVWPARSCGNREPGRRPTTVRRRSRVFASARTPSSRAACPAPETSPIGARVSPALRGVTASEPAARRAMRNRDRYCAIAAACTARSVWLSSALHQLLSNAGSARWCRKCRRAWRGRRGRRTGRARRVEPAKLIAVEFPVGGKSDVVDVEIEAHADGVGGDEIIDIARSDRGDLRIARARRERAEHNRGAAALAADQFGDGVDLLRREGDDGGTARSARSSRAK